MSQNAARWSGVAGLAWLGGFAYYLVVQVAYLAPTEPSRAATAGSSSALRVKTEASRVYDGAVTLEYAWADLRAATNPPLVPLSRS